MAKSIAPKYRHSLPQLGGKLFLADGGLETMLIFHDGWDLPKFAAFPLLDSERGRAALNTYYERFIPLARERGMGFILDAATWRANPDWGIQVGYDRKRLPLEHTLRFSATTPVDRDQLRRQLRVTPAPRAVSIGGWDLQVEVSLSLDPGVSYRLELDGAKDLLGNRVRRLSMRLRAQDLEPELLAPAGAVSVERAAARLPIRAVNSGPLTVEVFREGVADFLAAARAETGGPCGGGTAGASGGLRRCLRTRRLRTVLDGRRPLRWRCASRRAHAVPHDPGDERRDREDRGERQRDAVRVRDGPQDRRVHEQDVGHRQPRDDARDDLGADRRAARGDPEEPIEPADVGLADVHDLVLIGGCHRPPPCAPASRHAGIPGEGGRSIGSLRAAAQPPFGR